MVPRISFNTGAQAEISGEVPVHATWSEDIYFRDESGAAMNLTGLQFVMQFRCNERNGPVFVLSTQNGMLSIENDDGAVPSILRIGAPAGTFSAYIGDMICDLSAVDQDESITLYGSGIVTFTNHPGAI